MSLWRRGGVMLFVVAGTVGCDRATKHIASQKLSAYPAHSFLGDTLRIGYAENTGGFLSLGANLPDGLRTLVFTVGTAILLAALAVVAWRSGWERWRTVALALFIGGGLSNWIDRATDGRVIDFLNVGIGSLRTGVFNVADVAIMAGMALFLLAEQKLLGRARESH
jgi:signal peptidase II